VGDRWQTPNVTYFFPNEKWYYNPDKTVDQKIRTKKLNAIKKFIRSLYTDQKKDDKKWNENEKNED
jgi:hypothetical protein